jgi:hypothetical protein
MLGNTLPELVEEPDIVCVTPGPEYFGLARPCSPETGPCRPSGSPDCSPNSPECTPRIHCGPNCSPCSPHGCRP